MSDHPSAATGQQVRCEELDAILQRRRHADLLRPEELARDIADDVQRLSLKELTDIALARAPFDYRSDPEKQRPTMQQWAEAAKAAPRDDVVAYVIRQFPGACATDVDSPPQDAETKAFQASFHGPHPGEPILRGLLRERAAQDLIGLALSGGGIRSASFNLGLLEAAHQNKVLRHVDYLSTVSGGGYIGSHLSSAMLQPEANLDDKFPLRAEPTGLLSPRVKKMIHGGKYLDDPVKFFNRYLVGLFYNNLVFAGALFVLCLFAAIVWRGLDIYPVHTFLQWISGSHLIDFNRPFLPCLIALVAWLLCWATIYWSWLCAAMPPKERVAVELGITVAFIVLAYALSYATERWELLIGRFWPFLLNFSVLLVALVLIWFYSWKTFVAGVVGFGLLTLVLVGSITDKAAFVGSIAWILSVNILVLPWLFICGFAYWKPGITGMVAWQKRWLIFAGVAFLLGWVVWLGTPNINLVSQRDKLKAPGMSHELENVQGYVLPVLLTALVVGLLPFLKPKELINSGERPKSALHGSVFTIASFALLGGIPLVLVFLLARHNISGESDDLGRPLVPTDLGDWTLFWPKLKQPAEQLLTAGIAAEDLSSNNLLRLERRQPGNLDPRKTKWATWLEVEHTRDRITQQLNDNLAGEQVAQKLLVTPGIRDAFFRSRNADLKSITFLDPTLQGSWDGLKQRLWDKLIEKNREITLTELEWQRLLTSPQLLEHTLKELTKGSREHPLKANEETRLKQLLEKLHRNELADTAQVSRKKERQTLNMLLLRAQFADDFPPRDRVRRSVVIEKDQAKRLNWLWMSALAVCLFALVVNANATSPHWFYREQLARAYIVPRARTDADTDSDSDTDKANTSERSTKRWKYDILLKDLRTTDKGAPYHLLCAAINRAGKGQDRVLDSSHFLFSQKYCGSEATQYESSETYMEGEMDLPSAMAISGAAVSPLRIQNPLVALIMTVFNLRLGQWLPRPDHVSRAPAPLLEMARRWPTFSALLVDSLAAGEKHEHRKFHFISDGGHDENLGVEQLLQRRCRFILASDAGQDQDHEFADLAKLYRRARLQGIRMWRLDRQGEPMNLEDLLLEKTSGLVQNNYLLVRIQYPDDPQGSQDDPQGSHRAGSEGLLIYLKPSFTGAEEVDLKYFRSQNPAFPHDPTVQVMYDPDQVESYRQLGASIGGKLCRDIKAGINDDGIHVGKLIAKLLERYQPAPNYPPFSKSIEPVFAAHASNGVEAEPKKTRFSAVRKHAATDRLAEPHDP